MKLLKKLLLLSVLGFSALSVASAQQPPATTSILKTTAAFTATFHRISVPVFVAKHDNPSRPNTTPTLSLNYLTPTDFERDAAGLPKLELQDAETGADTLEVPLKSGAKQVVKSAAELARLVRERQIDPKTPVRFIVKFRQHDQAELLSAVREAAAKFVPSYDWTTAAVVPI
ncbi:MAG: hypothetical protein ACRCZF_02350, partial [Gemmataceae bacterium]